jgi:hypothetical protein
MAIDLIKRNKCHNFVIIEKSTSVGGTWHDNKYPGCCCDVWSALYSYSFEQNPDWSREYPGQEEILVRALSPPPYSASKMRCASLTGFLFVGVGVSQERGEQVPTLQVYTV